jgi:hypothetical protein
MMRLMRMTFLLLWMSSSKQDHRLYYAHITGPIELSSFHCIGFVHHTIVGMPKQARLQAQQMLCETPKPSLSHAADGWHGSISPSDAYCWEWFFVVIIVRWWWHCWRLKISSAGGAREWNRTLEEQVVETNGMNWEVVDLHWEVVRLRSQLQKSEGDLFNARGASRSCKTIPEKNWGFRS